MKITISGDKVVLPRGRITIRVRDDNCNLIFETMLRNGTIFVSKESEDGEKEDRSKQRV